MQLRDYQLECVESVWGRIKKHNNALVVLPTASGKTEIFIELIRKSIDAKPDVKIVILVGRVTLVEQTARRVQNVVPQVGVFCGSLNRYETDHNVIVASIQSVAEMDLGRLNMIILDEAHNVDSDDGRYFDFIDNHKHDKLKIVAFTATPYRNDGYIYGDGKMFDEITFQRKMPEMIEAGFLVRPRMKRPDHQHDVSSLHVRGGEFKMDEVCKLVEDDNKIKAQIADALPRMTDRKCVVWCCASIDHAEMVAEELEEQGDKVSIVHSKMHKSDREQNLFAFENGINRHLVFITIVSEGYDHRPIDCVVLMRPIRSPTLYVQTVGRALRLSPETGKDYALILDYGKVVETCGALDNPIIRGTKRGAVDVPIKACPNCLEYVNRALATCPVCEYVFFAEKRDVTKSLTQRASAPVEMLGSKVNLVIVTDVKLAKHISKNGNECLRIDYLTDNLLDGAISEYFMTTSEWGYKKALNRLVQLRVAIKSTIDEQVKCAVQYKPTKLIYEMDGKYKKITGLKFD